MTERGFHHFQFDHKTSEPVKGITFQGYSDESCYGDYFYLEALARSLKPNWEMYW